MQGFGWFLGAKLEACWQPNPSKIDVICEKRIFEKPKLFFSKERIVFKVRGSKLGIKMDQKAIEKGIQSGKACWHRFLNDFVGFGVPTWGGKSSENRSKKASKKRWKKEERPDGKKVATRSSNVPFRRGSEVQGRSPLKGGTILWGPRDWSARLPKSSKVL